MSRLCQKRISASTLSRHTHFQNGCATGALAIGKAFPCRKVGEAVLGLEVPHAHIHLIPMQNEKDMLFSNPKLKLTDEEFKAVAEAIRAAL